MILMGLSRFTKNYANAPGWQKKQYEKELKEGRILEQIVGIENVIDCRIRDGVIDVEHLMRLRNFINRRIESLTNVTIPRVRIKIEEAPKQWKRWAKTIEEVDQRTASGYAFHGTFIKLGRTIELPIGTVILVVTEYLDASPSFRKIELYTINNEPDKPLKLLYEKTVECREWALMVRDDIKELIDIEKIKRKGF